MLNARRPTRAAVVLGGAIAAVALAGCDSDQIGAAAVVDGDRITVGELQDEVRAFHEFAGTEPTGDQAELQRSYLESEIRHRIVERVGADVGVSVSEAEIDQYIADEFRAQNPEGDLTQLMIDNMLTEDAFREAIHDTILIDEITAELGDQAAVREAFDAAAERMDVEVNPRYGTWENVALNPDSGSISEPAAQ